MSINTRLLRHDTVLVSLQHCILQGHYRLRNVHYGVFYLYIIYLSFYIDMCLALFIGFPFSPIACEPFLSQVLIFIIQYLILWQTGTVLPDIICTLVTQVQHMTKNAIDNYISVQICFPFLSHDSTVSYLIVTWWLRTSYLFNRSHIIHILYMTKADGQRQVFTKIL
jgi:hypothetical protein